jgi:hypothetical protein
MENSDFQKWLRQGLGRAAAYIQNESPAQYRAADVAKSLSAPLRRQQGRERGRLLLEGYRLWGELGEPAFG